MSLNQDEGHMIKSTHEVGLRLNGLDLNSPAVASFQFESNINTILKAAEANASKEKKRISKKLKSDKRKGFSGSSPVLDDDLDSDAKIQNSTSLNDMAEVYSPKEDLLDSKQLQSQKRKGWLGSAPSLDNDSAKEGK